MIPVSLLDLVRVREGGDAKEALDSARTMAQIAEKAEFRRVWVAEHHNIGAIASAATSLVISHIASGTSKIRVGAGGIMLPNHAPLIVAEQFGTLATLYPGRIDLGLGRAPGTDQMTMRAMRRGPEAAEEFPRDVIELQSYFKPLREGQKIQAIPAAGTEVPLWILGSSMFGAYLAAELGLPYAFASHFAPDMLMPAMQAYRQRFKPSAQLDKPYAIVAANVIGAETDADADHLFTTAKMSFTNLVRGTRLLSQPPVADIDSYWTPTEKNHVMRMLACSVVGGPDTLRRNLRALVEETGADEVIIASDIFDPGARAQSIELTGEAAKAA